MPLQISCESVGSLLTSQTYDVLASGRVESFDASAVIFGLAANFVVRVAVVRVKEDSDKGIFSAVNGNVLTLEIKIIDERDRGFGWVTPRNLGTLDGRELWARFRVSPYTDSSSTATSFDVDYTFYAGAQVK